MRCAQDIHRNLLGIPFPVDIAVPTPEVLERHRDTVGLIFRDALRVGRSLYVR